MPDAPFTLSCHDDLDASLAYGWGLLVRGAADRRSPMRTPVLATTGLDGAPEARTVVLRSADAAQWALTFHTDRRSGKIRELEREPRATIVAYDAGSKIQLRCWGKVSVHSGDRRAADAWARSQPHSRIGYRQALPPGTSLATPRCAASDPDVAQSALLAQPAAGLENFVVLALAIEQMEWLYLAHLGHRRARFARSPSGRITSTWLVP